MQTAAAKPATELMTKREVCDALGKSMRTVSEYMAKGKLPVQYVSGTNGRQAFFKSEDVQRLKGEFETPLVKVVPAGKESISPAVSNDAGGGALAFVRNPPPGASDASVVAAFKAAMYERPAEPKPFMDIEAASLYSGLPERLLRRLIRQSRLPAERLGWSLYVKRSDLDHLNLSGRPKP